jgi:ectoine hydroxylase-related dioxygenase (phytanoyl-CoA dioxygenase family)
MSDNALAGQKADDAQTHEWVERFHRDGFLFLPNVLPSEWCAELRADLDWALEHNPNGLNSGTSDGTMRLCHRMFEFSEANRRLFDMEPIVSFAEALVAPNCHVIHNNSFTTKPGGGITTWHQDDPPHFLVTEGEPPKNIRLPVLVFTANYYLTDVPEPKYGGTETIPGSHLFGASPPASMEGTPWEAMICHNSGPAGSVVMFNCQVWHRGGPNRSDRTRYITQVTYARRLVGHKYYPFVNYQMPESVYKDANPRLKRLLGFLDHGAYG